MFLCISPPLREEVEFKIVESPKGFQAEEVVKLR